MHGISKVRAKLSSLCIICSLGQVKFSLDKYILAINLSWASIKFCYFHTLGIIIFWAGPNIYLIVVLGKRGSYMSAHVLLNLLNKLKKRDKIQGSQQV